MWFIIRTRGSNLIFWWVREAVGRKMWRVWELFLFQLSTCSFVDVPQLANFRYHLQPIGKESCIRRWFSYNRGKKIHPKWNLVGVFHNFLFTSEPMFNTHVWLQDLYMDLNKVLWWSAENKTRTLNLSYSTRHSKCWSTCKMKMLGH